MKPASGNKENKMGTMKIPYLLFNMACPLTVSLMVQAMYNLSADEIEYMMERMMS